MRREEYLGGVFYKDASAFGFIHPANARHGSVFIYKTDVGGNVQHTLPPVDMLPHRAGFLWFVLNLGPGSLNIHAQGSSPVPFVVPCQTMAMVFLRDHAPDPIAEQEREYWAVKLLPLRGQTLFTCVGDTVSSVSSSSASASGSGSGSGSDSGSASPTTTTSTPGSMSCHASLESICDNFWTPSSSGDDPIVVTLTIEE